MSLLLHCGARHNARSAGGARLAGSLVARGIARGAPREPDLLILSDPVFQPTLAGPISGRGDGDFARLARQFARLRKRADRPGQLEHIFVAPELAARSRDLGPVLAGLRAGAPHARIEAGLTQSRRDYLRACAQTDLVIAGAGLAALERCAAGLAQILIPDGRAEERLAGELDRTGAAMKLNSGDDIAAAIERALADLRAMPAMLRLMREAALDLAGALDPGEALAAIAALADVQMEKPSTISALSGSA